MPILVVDGFAYHPKVGAHLRKLSELGTTTLNAYETVIDLCYEITFSRVFLRPTWNFYNCGLKGRVGREGLFVEGRVTYCA